MGKTVFRDPADYVRLGGINIYQGEPTYLPITKGRCRQVTWLLFFVSILPIIAIAVTLGGREEGAHDRE